MTTCVLDTDVVIAALDRRDHHHPRATKLLRALVAANVTLRLSTVNYAEALIRPAANETTMRTALAAIEALGVEPVASTPAIARDAARLRARENISLPAGFTLATAQAFDASVATFDKRVRRALRPAGLRLTPELR